jgi:hypothetical protein
MVILMPVSFVYALLVLGKIWMNWPANPDLKALSPEVIRNLFDSLLWGQVLWGVIMQPVTWFFVLLTAECYRRFKAKRSGDVFAAAPGSIAI